MEAVKEALKQHRNPDRRGEVQQFPLVPQLGAKNGPDNPAVHPGAPRVIERVSSQICVQSDCKVANPA
tara:strand:- start:849 stop:1052 length:204 start_codon:yes stop_codon:yes gene_type:complete